MPASSIAQPPHSSSHRANAAPKVKQVFDSDRIKG